MKRVIRFFVGLCILIVGYLMTAVFFELPPIPPSVFEGFEASVAHCAGEELESSYWHACGNLDPRNLMLTGIFGLMAMFVGVGTTLGAFYGLAGSETDDAEADS